MRLRGLSVTSARASRMRGPRRRRRGRWAGKSEVFIGISYHLRRAKARRARRGRAENISFDPQNSLDNREAAFIFGSTVLSSIFILNSPCIPGNNTNLQNRLPPCSFAARSVFLEVM